MAYHHVVERALINKDKLEWLVVFTDLHFICDAILFILFNGGTCDL